MTGAVKHSIINDASRVEKTKFQRIRGSNIVKKETKSKEMDMLNGGLAGKLILFAIPLALSSILQQHSVMSK